MVENDRAFQFLKEEAGPTPFHFKGFSVEIVEVLELEVFFACGESDLGGSWIATTVDVIVFDDHFSVDEQPGAIVGVEREEVFALIGDEKFGAEAEAKVVAVAFGL